MSYKNFKRRLKAREIKKNINIYDNKSFDDMTKKELDQYALNEANIELDRRKTKTNMFREFITKLIKGEK